MIRAFLASLVAVFLTTACAPTTELTIRKDNEHRQSFNIEQPYQQAYKTVLDKTRDCFLHTPRGVQLTVVGTRDNKERVGEIVVAEVWSEAEREVVMLIDVASVTESDALVSAYTNSRKGMRFVKAVRNWLENSDSTCAVTS